MTKDCRGPQLDQVLIESLISKHEDQWFERKSGRTDPKDLARPLVALANAEGGRVVVGIHDGKLDPPPQSKINDLRQAPHDFTNPPVRVRVEELPTEAGPILVMDVAPGATVHETNRGDCFLRIGDESRQLNYAQRRELEFDRGYQPFDGTPAPTDDLNVARLEKLQDAIGAATAEGTLRARNLLTTDDRTTIAAYLLFSDHPQTEFPNAYVRVLRYDSDERGTGQGQRLVAGADHRIEGPLTEQILKAAEIIDELIPQRQALRDDTIFGPEPLLPRAAWMEALVNAVTHRSYSQVGDHIRVEIFPNRLEVTSPGRFPGIVDLSDPLSIPRHARNPRIARTLAELGFTQELGEGIKRIFDEVRRRGLTDPVYEQTSSASRITLRGADALPASVTSGLSSAAMRVLDALRNAERPLGTGEVAELLGIARPTAGRHLKTLRDQGLVKWTGQSPRDPRASWSIS